MKAEQNLGPLMCDNISKQELRSEWRLSLKYYKDKINILLIYKKSL